MRAPTAGVRDCSHGPGISPWPEGLKDVRAGTNPERLLALEVSAFGFFGLFWGCFAVLLADLSGALGLSPGLLGVALLVGAGASIASMGALGWASDRLGRRAYLILAAAVFGAGITGLALSGSYAALRSPRSPPWPSRWPGSWCPTGRGRRCQW